MRGDPIGAGSAQARAYRRAILMKTENRHYLRVWEYGKPQLYGRAAWTVQAIRRQSNLKYRMGKLHFNQDGIKRRGFAHVGKFFRCQHIYVASSGTQLRPGQVRSNHPGRHRTIYAGPQQDVTASIESSYAVAIANTTG